MDDGKGMKAAVEMALDAASDEAAACVQLPLLPSDELAGLPADAMGRARALREGKRGPGRPAGARNRKTEDFARFLLSRHASPLQVMAETYSRPVQDLAAELGCSVAEAFKLQLLAARELAPYLHGKMPVAVDLNTNVPVLNLVLPGGQGVQNQSVDFQGLIDVTPGRLGCVNSDASPESLESRDFPPSDHSIADQTPGQAEAAAQADQAGKIQGTPPMPPSAAPLFAHDPRRTHAEIPEPQAPGPLNSPEQGQGQGAGPQTSTAQGVGAEGDQ